MQFLCHKLEVNVCVCLDMGAASHRQDVSDRRIRRGAMVCIDPQTNMIWIV